MLSCGSEVDSVGKPQRVLFLVIRPVRGEGGKGRTTKKTELLLKL